MENMFKKEMNEKNKKQRNFWIISGIGILLIVLLACSLFFPMMNKKGILEKDSVQYGIEVKADINGDKKNERVYVTDNVSGDNAFTQISAQFEDGETVFKDYPDYWSSYLMTGDLTGDGISDVLLMRFAIGSTYGGGEFSVLHMEENEWKEYPHNFISSSLLETEQPENFEQLACLGAAIVPVNGQCQLRIIAVEDMMEDTAKCIDCSYREEGWFIENIQIIEKYFEMDKEAELLGLDKITEESAETVAATENITPAETAAVTETAEPAENTVFYISYNGEVQQFDNDNVTGLIKNIRSLAWLAPRGGLEMELIAEDISEEENRYIQQSSNGEENADSDLVWLRISDDINNEDQGAGTSISENQDILAYIQDEDMYIGIQNASLKWDLWKLPGYGDWFEKEIKIFIRVATGM